MDRNTVKRNVYKIIMRVCVCVYVCMYVYVSVLYLLAKTLCRYQLQQ